MPEAIIFIIKKIGAEFFKIQYMRIEPAPADLVSTWLWNKCFLKSCQHGTCKHDRSAEPSALAFKFFASQVIQIYIICLEGAGMPVCAIDLYIHFMQQLDEIIDVKYVRNIGDG